MSQFDNVGPGGVPSIAKPVQIDPNNTVMAQVSNGQIPANTNLVLGSGVGANVFGGSRPSDNIMRLMSIGHVVPNLPLNAQPATPPASGVSSGSVNKPTQIVASIAAGVMTVTGIVGTFALYVGTQLLGPAGWPQGLSIISNGTGTGGLGTYNVSAPGVASTSISAPSATVVISTGSNG